MIGASKVNGPAPPPGTAPAETATTLQQLRVIRVVAIVDFALLVPLVAAALNRTERVVDVLGPIHGAGFLLLLFLCLRGVGQDRWGWWFPALVVVTLGPPGSLIGERRIRRQLPEPLRRNRLGEGRPGNIRSARATEPSRPERARPERERQPNGG